MPFLGAAFAFNGFLAAGSFFFALAVFSGAAALRAGGLLCLRLFFNLCFGFHRGRRWRGRRLLCFAHFFHDGTIWHRTTGNHRHHARRKCLGPGLPRFSVHPQESARFAGRLADAGAISRHHHRAVYQDRVLDDRGPEITLTDETVIELKLQKEMVVAADQALIHFAQHQRQALELVLCRRGDGIVDQTRLMPGSLQRLQHILKVIIGGVVIERDTRPGRRRRHFPRHLSRHLSGRLVQKLQLHGLGTLHIGLGFKGHALAGLEPGRARRRHRHGGKKHVPGTVIRRDEAESLRLVEELDGAFDHEPS